MARIKLKVCGMRDPANILEIGKLGPDYLGFIFYSASPRFVGREFRLPESRADAKRVGVFVNETFENIVQNLKSIGSTIAQLHGTESPDDCQRLKDTDVRVIKAVPIGQEFDPGNLGNYVKVVDFFLFDTKGKLFGGNAVKFDWRQLQRYEHDVPFFLSGGIGVEDLSALGGIHSRLHAVDLNSGVEVSPGLKDPSRVRQAEN